MSNQTENYLSEGFRNVDSQTDIEKFKECLAFMETLPSFRRYKEETGKLLRPADGRYFIDIGCGLGFDVERLANATSAKIIGLDSSHEFLNEARERAQSLGLANIDYVVADALQTCFKDGQFDGARVDRTLQHVEHPELAIREMARIVRKGGRLVCAEPDWGSFFVDDDDTSCVEAVCKHWTMSIRNPQVARELPRLMKLAGVANIRASGHLLATYGLHEVDMIFDLKKTCEILSEKNGDHFDIWYDKLAARDRWSPVFAGVTIILAAGTKEGTMTAR